MQEKLQHRIARFEQAINRLKKYSTLRLDELFEKDVFPAVEREVHVAIEALLDVGNAIIAAEGWTPPKTYKSIPRELRAHDVFTETEAEWAEELTGLRNILVHLYADVDYKLLHEELPLFIERVSNLMAKLLRYLDERGLDPPLP
ncbi:MAG: DUF86 domain-containing protein [Aigarchaeota archaeon]|nr:DUF86 domain-containing protein [Candidatus Pelearchaeum maunauluense]